MEYLLQYEYTITYIKGKDNTIADVLSRLTELEEGRTEAPSSELSQTQSSTSRYRKAICKTNGAVQSWRT